MGSALDAIVLAAGRGSRFGAGKCLLAAGPGETLLSRAVALAAGVVAGRVAAVVGHEAAPAAAEVERVRHAHPAWRARVSSVVNPDYAAGLSTSLAAGLAALPESPGILILLADQPAVDPARLEALVQRYEARGPAEVAIAPAVGGDQRTPVIVAPALFPALRALRGDQGARRLLAAEPPGRVVLVEWGEGLWCVDVDTPEDYARVARILGW